MDTLRDLWNNPTARAVLAVLVTIGVIWVFRRLALRVVRKNIHDQQTRFRVQKGVSFVAFVLMVALVFAQVGGSLSGLSVAIGAASAGIAFALQEVIVSFAGWLGIVLGGFYKVGDRVQLGGIRGDVIDIGMLRTTMMEVGGWVEGDLHNGRIVRVANSFVFKDPVFNYNSDFPFLWDELTVPIKFGSDYEAARTMLNDIAQTVVGEYTEGARVVWDHLSTKYQVERSRVDPLVTLVVNDNWVEFTLRYVVDYRKRRITKDALFTKLLAAVEGSGGRVAFASATFQLVEAPPLEVNLHASPRPPEVQGSKKT